MLHSMRILFLAGGTGGHVFPLIPIVQSLREKAASTDIGLELLVLGDGEFIREAANKNNLQYKEIFAGKLRRYFSFLTILDILKMPVGFIQSLWYLFWFMPDVIFAKGGYSSVAPAIVGKLYFIPLYIHESDAVPGLANRFLAKFAKGIFISIKSSEKYFNSDKTILVGHPIRKELLNGNRDEAIRFFNLSGDRKTVLVLGGSQGAKKVNEIILDTLVMLVKNDLQVIHQCGSGQLILVQKEINEIIKEGEGKYSEAVKQNYRLYPFLDPEQLAMAYAFCDLIISRAGAGLIFEIAAIGKPAIIIPLSTNASRGEQIMNAQEFSKFGAVFIEEENLTPHILINQIESLLESGDYSAISDKIKSFAMVDAADRIAFALLPS